MQAAIARDPEAPPSAGPGKATGIGAHADPVDYFGGRRTLWPIAVVYFLFFGIIPTVAGIYLGRRSTRSP